MVNGVTDINYKELLKKYMKIVRECEGTTFAEDVSPAICDPERFGITHEDAEILNKMDEDIA